MKLSARHKKKTKNFSGSLFEPIGWHVEPQLINSVLIDRIRVFLVKRQQILEKNFEKWVNLNSSRSYAWHQRRLISYEDAGLPNDLRHYLCGEYDLKTRLDQLVIEPIKQSFFIDFICKLLKVRHFLVHYPPMVRFKVADAPVNLVPPHQDIAYNCHLDDFITTWIPLTDICAGHGGIVIYEGSQRDGVLPHASSGAWSNKAKVNVSKYPKKHITMKIGDVLFFSPLLLHKSANHEDKKPRYSIDYRIFLNDIATTKSFYDPFSDLIRRVD